MPALGPRSLIDIALPTGIDATEIMRFEMREGMTPTEVIEAAVTRIGDVNTMLAAKYGGLYISTQRMWARLRQGDGERTMTPTASEFSDPDGVRTDKIGHMLRLGWYKDATEWSVAYLREAIREDVNDDLTLIAERWENRVDFEVIERMLTNTEYAVGGAGWAVPWAIGTGTNVNYIPPQWMSYIFDSTHTHFIKINEAIDVTNTAAQLEAMALHLAHHGHTGQKVCYVSEGNMSIFDTLVDNKKFAKFYPASFTLGPSSSNNNDTPVSVFRAAPLEGVPGETIAWFASNYGMVEIKWHPRVPTNYLWMGKSYGVNDPRNPMALREDPLFGGFGLTVNPQIDRSITPKLEKMLFEAKHGVNVNDRTNGVACLIDTSGTTWVNPTIS